VGQNSPGRGVQAKTESERKGLDPSTNKKENLDVCREKSQESFLVGVAVASILGENLDPDVRTGQITAMRKRDPIEAYLVVGRPYYEKGIGEKGRRRRMKKKGGRIFKKKKKATQKVTCLSWK